jgi:hypothetical protein
VSRCRSSRCFSSSVILWLTWRRNTDLNDNVAPYREWSSFETWTGGISGREASMQILLPIAAVAFGMTIFGLVFLFAVPHLGS